MPNIRTIDMSETGIWGHSSKEGSNKYFMISLPSVGKEYDAFKAALKKLDISSKDMTGCVLDRETNTLTTDRSLLINSEHYNVIEDALLLPRDVLLLGPTDARDRRPCTGLDRETNKLYHIGSMRSVSYVAAHDDGSFVVDPETCQHFVIEPTDTIGRLQTEPLKAVEKFVT